MTQPVADISANSPAAAGESCWQMVEAFYRHEVRLLQARRYRDWLGLMDADMLYRVPVTTSTAEGLVVRDNALGYYDEDLELLNARVDKLESKHSWVEQPPSRLRYFVQLLDLETADEGGFIATSNILLFQHRWNLDQHFSGERRDLLVRDGDGLKIRDRLVVLDRQTFTHQGLSVFF